MTVSAPVTGPNTAPVTHLRGFPIIDGQLAPGGVPLTRLAERLGQTPFYAYDRALITERVAAVRAALPESVHLSYAVKANPMPAVVQHLAGLVDGFDLASTGEMKTALDTPMPAHRISFAGPGKTDAELRQAVAAGVTINAESRDELDRLAATGEALGLRPSAALRVNPDFDLKGSGMRMGGGAKPFGIDAEAVPEALAALAGHDLAFAGFHLYWGSQALKADLVQEAQRQSIDLALRLAEDAGRLGLPAPPRLNLGGGFGIPYFPKDTPLDLKAIGTALAPLVEDLARTLPEATPALELGRYLVGEAGLYVARVVERKVSRGQVFLVTDGGLHHHLAASGNFGQGIRRNYPVVVGNKIEAPDEETASVVGCLCTPLDLLADRIDLPRAEPGDLIAIFQSGAYGATASPQEFLSHPRLVEALV